MVKFAKVTILSHWPNISTFSPQIPISSQVSLIAASSEVEEDYLGIMILEFLMDKVEMNENGICLFKNKVK